MKRVGIFLGVEPSNGGMFQYALSILESLDRLRDDGFEIKVVYVDELWKPILDNFRFEAIREFGSYFGLRLAEAFMVARIPGGIARCVASKINPISRTIKRQACDIWIFPAQDALSYQVDVPVAATVHDLMHRYESEFPEVSHRQRYRLREHRFKNLTAWATAVLVDSKIGKEHVINSYATPPDKVYPLPYVAPSYIH